MFDGYVLGVQMLNLRWDLEVYRYIYIYIYSPPKTKMTMENSTMNEDVFPIEKMEMFQPVMLVNSGVYH